MVRPNLAAREASLLRAPEVIEGKLVERGHVAVVDRKGALKVALCAVEILQVDVFPTHVRAAVRSDLVGVAKHLKHGQVDERRHILEVRVVDRLLEAINRGVYVSVGLELIERELCAGIVKLRIVRQRLLEVPLGFLVVAAPLIGKAGVVRSCRQLPLGLCRSRALEHMRGIRAGLVRPVVGLIVGGECIESGPEPLERRLLDGRRCNGSGVRTRRRGRSLRFRFTPTAARAQSGGNRTRRHPT